MCGNYIFIAYVIYVCVYFTCICGLVSTHKFRYISLLYMHKSSFLPRLLHFNTDEHVVYVWEQCVRGFVVVVVALIMIWLMVTTASSVSALLIQRIFCIAAVHFCGGSTVVVGGGPLNVAPQLNPVVFACSAVCMRFSLCSSAPKHLAYTFIQPPSSSPPPEKQLISQLYRYIYKNVCCLRFFFDVRLITKIIVFLVLLFSVLGGYFPCEWLSFYDAVKRAIFQ